ncbi:unnamed protein product [Alopecurus aequalis]
MEAPAAPASVLQLSIFTTVKSIPRPERYADFPVTVRLVAPGRDQTVRAPIDIVAAIDRSMSVSDDQRLEKEKAALALVVKMLLPGDRLAVVPFDDSVAKDEEELVVMSAEAKEKTLSTVKSLQVGPGKGTWLAKALERAEQILLNRGDVDRAAFIILLSDGEDSNILKEKEWTRHPALKNPAYPVHSFGFSGQDPQKKAAETMGYIATRTQGTYTPVDVAGGADKFVGAVAGLVGKATSRLFSAVGVGAELAAVHPGVSLVRIDSGDRKASIGGDARSGAVELGAMSAGETLEFTVYLDVPEGDPDVEATEVLSVGGAYTQGWDYGRVKLVPSVVSVERPVPPPPQPPVKPDCPCKELDLIEERLKYWCKVKLDLATMYEKAEAELVGGVDCKCNCEVAAALRESSMESVNRAMHHDIYTAVVHALRLRKCATAKATEHGCDGDKAVSTTETA